MILGTVAVIVTLALGLLTAPLAAESQQAGKVYRIGLLSPASRGLGMEAFREGLRTLGLRRRSQYRHRAPIGRGEI